MGAQKTILWDFDHTLAYRPRSRGLFLEVLDENEPGHTVRTEDFLPLIEGCFPWNRPHEAHLNLTRPDAWWAEVEKVFSRAYEQLGIDKERAFRYAHQVHQRYVLPMGFLLYDDTIMVLEKLRLIGWHHYIFSNHMPELAELVRGLGLGNLIDDCISSALIGYEKPHPEAFNIALQRTGYPKEIWMIGDNPVADVTGAQAAGIKAILVHNEYIAGIKHQTATLTGAARIIEPTADFY